MVVKIKQKNKRQAANHMNGQDNSASGLTGMLAEAIRFHQSGKIEEAEKLYRKILLADPENSDALHLTGVIAYQRGDNVQAAGYIRRAIDINPGISFYHNNLGNVLNTLHETDEAIKCFEESIRLKYDNVEAHNNLGNSLRDLGRHEEALQHYRKAIDFDPDYAAAHNNLANQLKDLERLDEAVIHYQTAVRHNSGSAEIYYNFGTVLKELGDIEGAVEQYSRALSINPGFAAVYNNLGNVFKEKQKIDDALVYYQKAVSLKPDFAEAHNNIGDVYRIQGSFGLAMEQCRKAIQLKPGDERFYLTLGNTFLAQGLLDEAALQYKKASGMDPDFADAHYNRGLVLLMKGEFKEGWREYEWRFRSREISRDIGYTDNKIPVWDGSPLNGRTILIMSEQGMGDHIQFARYIPMVKKMGGRVIFESRRELIRLFRDYEGIDILLQESDRKSFEAVPDVCIQLLCLPRIFGTASDTICADVPYLKADSETAAKWKARFENGMFKVGLVWSGSPSHRNDRNRSCRLSDFEPLAAIPGVSFYSMQKGELSDDRKRPPGGMQIEDIGKDFEDFMDTAAAMEHLDLVISVDTAVVHLAGALGREVWTLLPFVPDWRWMLERDDTPWYPTMRLFRQPEHGDWKSVMKMVAAALEKKVILKGAQDEQR